MTQTLRRELRMKFEEILVKSEIFSEARSNLAEIGIEDQIDRMTDDLCVALAVGALEVSAIAKRAELAKANPEWAIMAGLQVDEESQKARQVEQEAVNAFESAFGLSSTWSEWWGIKAEWKRMRNFVTEQFRADAEVFRRYVAWYDDKGKFAGGMNATQIRRDPVLFFTAWDMFKRQDGKPTQHNTQKQSEQELIRQQLERLANGES